MFWYKNLISRFNSHINCRTQMIVWFCLFHSFLKFNKSYRDEKPFPLFPSPYSAEQLSNEAAEPLEDFVFVSLPCLVSTWIRWVQFLVLQSIMNCPWRQNSETKRGGWEKWQTVRMLTSQLLKYHFFFFPSGPALLICFLYIPCFTIITCKVY